MRDVGLDEFDPELALALKQELDRQKTSLELIPSENMVSRAVLEAQGSVLTNKYAEGYPGKRYYGGCEYVDKAESLALERLKELFGADYANVQPHSGSQANMAAYLAAIKPGDPILGMDLSHGGHLTHGHPANFSGLLYQVHSYGVRQSDCRLDYDQVRELALKHRPKMIIAGASAYCRIIDFQAFESIAKEVEAVLMVDMAHIAGLVAAGCHPSPVPYADIVTSTTHKTLRGPRGGIILAKDSFRQKLNSRIFPGIQGGPLMHVIAAKAVAFKEALQPEFKVYCQQVVANAKVLAETLMNEGFDIVTGGTDTHLMLVDLRSKNLTGKEAEARLDRAGLTVNKNTVPFETQSAMVASGIRLGTPSITTRGLRETEMKWLGKAIARVLETESASDWDQVQREVRDICSQYPVYEGL